MSNISESELTVEEYIRNEWLAERPSDFIDGKLFVIPGAKDINNEVAGQMLFILIDEPERNRAPGICV